MNFTNTSAVFISGGCSSVRCIFSFAENIIIAAAFFAVIIVSLTGNTSVCYVILTKKNLRTTSSLSTLNLALSDLLVTIVCAPMITIDLYIAKTWIFGEALCKVVPVVQKISVNASIINLFVVSLEKFMAICFPFCFRARKRSFAYGVPIVWLLAIAVAAPSAKYVQLISTPSSSYCLILFPDETSNIFAVMYTLAFFIPLIIMICLQLTTIHSLSKRSIAAKITFMSQHNNRRRKAAVVLIIVMLSFLACWTPIYLLAFVNKFSEVTKSMDKKTLNIIYAVFTWMFYACAAVHPFIYFLMTPQGSSSFKRFKGAKGKQALRRRLISKPSNAGSNLGSMFLTRESRV